MRVRGNLHLTYCTNIHPCETWEATDAALRATLPVIRRQLNLAGPFAVGLRLSAAAAATLASSAVLERFRGFLAESDCYILSINGFPYGAFHGQRVKERVYEPDWRHDARVAYSNQLADILAALLPIDAEEGSVSTVPGAFRPAVNSEADKVLIATNVLRHAAHLVALRERTGRVVTLAIEPEPHCLLETTVEAAQFFARYLFDPDLVATAARATGSALTVEDVRRHVGVCLDMCHMAVEFEDAPVSLRALAGHGIRVCKVQVSSALQLEGRNAAELQTLLAPFAEDTYLHQVVERAGSQYARYADLPEALTAIGTGGTQDDAPRDWRVHFHVPLFLASMNGFETTQPYVRSMLDLVRQSGVCSYFEVETYTWDVLPAEYRGMDVCTAITRELAWTRAQLER